MTNQIRKTIIMHRLTPEQTAQLLEFMQRYSSMYYQPKSMIEKYDLVWVDELTHIKDDIYELKSGEHAMTGTEYLKQAYNDGAKYKHCRAMLQEIWNIQYKHPSNRFDIDGSFGYDNSRIIHFIEHNASTSEINQAHEIVKEIYLNRGRGRPKGARNKSHVVNNSIDNIIEDIQIEENLKIEAPKSNGGTQNFSSDELQRLLKAYVTKNEMYDENYITEHQLTKVAGNIETAVQAYVNNEINKIKINQPTIIELKRNELPTLSLGVQHRNFTTLLKMCSASLRSGAHLNVWIYGPAGTGKSTAAEKIAEALSLKFYTNGKLATDFQVLGYKDGHGVYQTTQFRLAFENGGIYLADEIDGSMPDAVLALNGALANGHCAFPDKVVSRHPNFIFVAAANTTGTGATIDYVGRFKQDAAFNDRFVFLDWPLDEALEDSLVANKDWLKVVRTVRANINRVGIKGHLITPRASIYGESLIAAGLEHEIVVASVLKKGLSQAQWDQVKPR